MKLMKRTPMAYLWTSFLYCLKKFAKSSPAKATATGSAIILYCTYKSISPRKRETKARVI